MKLLLDTHVFLWWNTQADRLPARFRSAVLNRENHLLLSVASLWEMQIKLQLGKLKLDVPLPTLIGDLVAMGNLEVLPISTEHVFALSGLPPVHADPFDRLIAATSIVEDARLVTVDRVFQNYPVRLFQAD